MKGKGRREGREMEDSKKGGTGRKGKVNEGGNAGKELKGGMGG